MIHPNDKHLTLVCYKSGYGGDFLCALLDKALGNLSFDVRDANNRYWGRNYVFGFVNEYVKSLHHIFSYYSGGDSVALIDQIADRIDWARSIKNTVEICYDQDEDEFVKNVIDLISSNLNLPYKYNVGNLHYTGEYEKFDVRRIYPNCSVFYLYTDNPLHYQYFHAFSAIKTNFNVIKNTDLKHREFFDQKNIPYAVKIDVGELFFTNTVDDKISELFSNTLGTEIHLDRDELSDYRDKNHALLARYFGEDFGSMNATEFRAKKLELFDMVKRGEIN